MVAVVPVELLCDGSTGSTATAADEGDVVLGSLKLPLCVVVVSVTSAGAAAGMRTRRPMTKAGEDNEEEFELEVELQRELAPPSIWGAAAAAVAVELLLPLLLVVEVAFVLLKDAFDDWAWVFRIIVLLS